MNIYFIEQRSQFFKLDKFNWYTFNPIMIDFDKDYCAITTFTFTFIVMGLGFYINFSNPNIDCGCQT